MRVRILFAGLLLAGCAGGAPTQWSGRIASTQFDVAAHMRAGREMQLSGEPFAQLLGYNLAGFDRTLQVTDQYCASCPSQIAYVTDPLGYALAVESYEYSKQPMNNLSFESGAGLSLMFGPVLNPDQQTGDAGYVLLANRYQQLAAEALASGPLGPGFVTAPAPADNPLNPYGWPGLWPVFAEFESFDPAIAPVAGSVNTCTWSGAAAAGSIGYGGATPGGMIIANYECDYNSLHLLDRESQVTKVLTPAALGYAVWKQGLWTINYWQTMQDPTGVDPIISVPDGGLSQIGQPGNQVVGQYQNPVDGGWIDGQPGVYLGDIPMEGWQGLTMLEEMDNKAQLLVSQLLSSDGANLTGVDLPTALAYDYAAPLLYFPAQVAVTETEQTSDPSAAQKYFPRPTAFALVPGPSTLQSLSGLIGGYGEAFATTDANNAQVGGSIPFLATFDGDPFPADDGRADGEPTLHDRALSVLKIALVDLDRLHLSPAGPVLADTATIQNGVATPGTTLTTVELCEAILALRNAFRGLNGSLQLYSNDTPDTLGAPSALDSTPVDGASFSGNLSAHITALIAMEADFLTSKLIAAGGAVANGYDLAAGAPDASPTDLAAEAGAIRALLDASLATNEPRYLAFAQLVEQDLMSRFWMADVRAFRTTAGQDGTAAAPLQWTPERFGLLSGALRQSWKQLANVPGSAVAPADLLDRLKRTYKLVANGWDDVNQDDHVQYPDECLWSGLQMGERALTGELGHPVDRGDRDQDCLREISVTGLPAALAGELDLTRR